MTPAEYVATIVLPTVDEFMGATGDRRRGYLACIAAAHVPDHLAKAKWEKRDTVRQRIRDRGEWFSDCEAIVTGICNASKHAAVDRDAPFKFKPGDDRHTPAFAWDTVGAGWSEARWSKPGLIVSHRGFDFFVDDCLNGFLHVIWAEFPNLFEGAAVSGTIVRGNMFAGFQRESYDNGT